MHTATTAVQQKLQERGYRVTQARLRVIEALATQAQPQTIQDLVALVESDEASVYRTIEMLRQERLIEEIVIPNAKPCFSLCADHHHHAVCESCGVIAHVPCNTTFSKVVPETFSSVHGHVVTLLGRCKKCA